MILSTLCYIEKEDKYLMLHRVKKEADVNKDKWIGVGGKFEDGESPEECVVREVREETGLMLTKYRFRGIVTFVSDKWETEYMHLFTAAEYEGEDSFAEWSEQVKESHTYPCKEGNLVWVPKSEIGHLHIWEGDKVFLRLLDEKKEFFSLKLCYEGEKLVEVCVF
uniref:NUDIX hydrolase n=1 Tax=Agathobacter sp. TaxID=2021311 RepID=UPI00405711D3